MKIVVDTNIVFSAILNTDSKLGRILLQSKHRFYSTNQLFFEIEKHKHKIVKITGFSHEELNEIIHLIFNKIRLIDVRFISNKIYQHAEQLTFDIDIDDTEFVALTEQLKGKLWTGDKVLQQGLINKGWSKFITTAELYNQF